LAASKDVHENDRTGKTVGADTRLERAKELYEQAVFGGDRDAPARAERELDEVEADLALARGRILHARFLQAQAEDPRELALFDRAAELYRALGDVRGEAEALFWIGTVHQVIHGDNAAALPLFERSNALAATVEDKMTRSYAVRHLGFVAMSDGRLNDARECLEESVQLRREIGFLPGVAAGLLALAELAAEEGRDDDARAALDEAASVAEASGAAGILHWIVEARTRLNGRPPG
jgi:tetratricopeptide (TPR) repeat protein